MNEITYSKPVSAEDAKMYELLLEMHLGAGLTGKVWFSTRLEGDESVAFKFVGSSPLEDDINAEIRILWRDV